jgi:rhodanese-related sulfurtransferase
MTTKHKFFIALIASLTLGLAPFTPEPHLVGKIKWVLGGANGMGIMDYWDLFLHGFPWVLLIYFGFQLLSGSDKKVNSKIKEALLKEDTVIIDVREAHEFEAGHAENAINMPLSTFDSSISSISKMKGTKLLYCKSGMRSAVATQKLKSAGIENVINVKTQSRLKTQSS